MKCYAKSSENLIVQLANLPPKPPFLSKSFHLFSCTGKTHYLCISSAKNKEQNKTFLPFNFQNIGRQLVQYAKEETTPSTNNTSIEESDQPSEYETLRANAMAEKERASQEKLNKVIAYTKQTLVSYLDETALNRLCGYVAEYYLLDTLPKVEPIKVDSQLKTIDIMHFGWNIGKAFSKPRLQTATFIKRVFTHTLRDSEISTIERKMSHTESECKIKLDRKIA